MTTSGEMIAGLARAWIGTPYRHGASLKGAGADCLGLVRGIWREILGREPVEVPPYTPDWGETGTDEILLRAALRHLVRIEPDIDETPGHVLLFRLRDGAVAKHLGVTAAVGAEARFVHAYSGHGVVESALTAPWRRRLVARFLFPAEI